MVGGVCHVRRFVPLPPVRNGREKRGVGFHQRPRQRHHGGRRAHVVSLGECEDAGERNVEARRQVALRVGRVTRVAVNHTAQVLLRLDDRGDVVEAVPPVGLVANVDDHRQVVARSERTLRAKRLLLGDRVGPLAVVVQTGLAHSHEVPGGQQRIQRLQLRIHVLADVVGMDAGRGEQGVVAGAKRPAARCVLDRRGHHDGLLDPGIGHALDHRGHVSLEALPRQVAVGVDEPWQRCGASHGRHTTLARVMGRNAHTSIMRAVPWVAVVVLGVFSIRQLSERNGTASPPQGEPPAATQDAARTDIPPGPASTPPDADRLYGEDILALRQALRAARADAQRAARALERERENTDREAAVRTALGGAYAATAARVASLSEQMTTLEAQIADLGRTIEGEPQDPSTPATLDDLVAALLRAEDDACAQPALDVLRHPDGPDRVRTDPKLRASLSVKARVNEPSPTGDEVLMHMLALDFDGTADPDPARLLRPTFVRRVLRWKHATPALRDGMVRLIATHGETLTDEQRTALAAPLVEVATDDALPTAQVAATRMLGLLRPHPLPVDALAPLLKAKSASLRTAAAYAVSRARGKLDAKALRPAVLQMLASGDADERLAATLLGARLFAPFDFDPYAPAGERDAAIRRLASQQGP